MWLKVRTVTKKGSSTFGLTSHSSQQGRSQYSYQEQNPSRYLKLSLEFKSGREL